MISVDEYFVFFSCGFGVIVAFGLFFRPLGLRNVSLAGTLFSAAYVQFLSNLITSKLIYHTSFLMYTQVPFGFMISPCIYLYVTSLIGERKKFNRRDLLHFAPALFFTLICMHGISAPRDEKLLIITTFFQRFTSFHLLAAIAMSILIGYLIALILKLRRVFHRENPMHRRFMGVFVVFISWVVLIVLKIVAMVTSAELLWRLVNCVFGLEFIHLYFIIQRYPVMMSYGSMSKQNSVKERPSSSRSVLENIDVEGLTKGLALIMEQEKLFCDEDITLGKLAHALEINSHQLSAFLNKTYNKNFNSFINSYRIDHAKSLLSQDPEASTLSIAFASGFNSYSAFFTAFKKATGLSPGDYKTKNSTK